MSNIKTAGGIAGSELLGIAFVVLKLTHYIDWPWKWVLAPFWMPLAFVLALLFFAVIAAARRST